MPETAPAPRRAVATGVRALAARRGGGDRAVARATRTDLLGAPRRRRRARPRGPARTDADAFAPASRDRGRRSSRAGFGIDGPYVAVPRRDRAAEEPRARWCEAFGLLDDRDVSLVIAGGAVRLGSRDATQVERAVAALPSRCARRVVLRLGYVDGVDQAGAAAGAESLAYPSLEEGFGFPVLEGFAAGVPVLTSTRPRSRRSRATPRCSSTRATRPRSPRASTTLFDDTGPPRT